MNERITRQSAHGRKLIFFPSSQDECVELQHHLLDMGFPWASGGRVPQDVDRCVANGLVVMNDRLYYRTPDDREVYTPCTLEQVNPDYMPPGQQKMLDLFSQLSAKIDVLSGKVDRMYSELYPDIVETKAGLRKPQSPRKGL